MDIDEKGHIRCPACGRKTKTKVYPDTELKRFPLFCPWCKEETVVDWKGGRAVTYRYVIELDPRTKKNHQMIAGTGKRCLWCGKPQKQFIRQGNANIEYVGKALPFLVPKPEEPIDYPVRVTYLFYMKTRRKVDVLNLCAAADDLLVEAKILKDDESKIVADHDGTRVLYDKERPRTEIIIQRIEI